VPNSNTATDLGLSWSPDGTRLAFISSENSQYNLELITIATAVRTLVLADAYWASWSPDGTKLVFARIVNGNDQDLYSININGTNLQRITNTPTLIEDKPSWSPDGTRIAYTGFFYVTDPNTNVPRLRSEVYTLNLSNGSTTQVTASGRSSEPDWSPDGTEIVYSRGIMTANGEFNSGDIYRVGQSGGTPTQLTTDSNRESQPSWGIMPFTPTATPTIDPGICVVPQAMMQAQAANAQPQAAGTPCPTQIAQLPTPTPMPTPDCISDPVSGINVRSAPDPTGGATLVSDGSLLIVGVFEGTDALWYRVVRHYPVVGGDVEMVGWVSSVAFNGSNPCGDRLPLENLTRMDAAGHPIPLPQVTPTPSPLPTLSITATPYPSPTPGPTPLPPQTMLCTDKPLWIQDLCRQGWNYLNDTQRESLSSLLSSGGIAADFISLDTWWLQNVLRGITDVPPSVWQADSLAQCAGNARCTGIVRNLSYLFENIPRMGVDLLSAAGTGQTINGSANTFQPGLLPTNAIPINTIWGHQVTSLACRDGRFGTTDSFADVCWVCQDLSTELYRAASVDLEMVMR
jgi:WD40-like Beta Propeller Repeat